MDKNRYDRYVGFDVSDYELVSVLIDEQIDNKDYARLHKLLKLKGKIYRELVARGLDKDIDDVIAKTWKITYLGTKDGVKRVRIERRQGE